jgi:hypothetical protein
MEVVKKPKTGKPDGTAQAASEAISKGADTAHARNEFPVPYFK